MGIYRIADSKELNIEKTFECGQCFRWNADEKGIYYGIAGNCPAKVFEEDGSVFVESEAPDRFWDNYFDMDTDYSKVSEPFLKVPYLDECTKKGMGIRILRQDPWEALCSFIISQCNNIKRIKGIVERLCSVSGEEMLFLGQKYYSFPTTDAILGCSEEKLENLRAGYRVPYIISAAKAVQSGKIDLEQLGGMNYAEAKRKLIELDGVGNKVADCVVLFGLHHMEAFPVDVWIKRALEEKFPADFNPESLGEYAGLAQQYIFYNMRG